MLPDSPGERVGEDKEEYADAANDLEGVKYNREPCLETQRAVMDVRRRGRTSFRVGVIEMRDHSRPAILETNEYADRTRGVR